MKIYWQIALVAGGGGVNKTLKMEQHVYKRHAHEPLSLILIALRTSHLSQCIVFFEC